MSALKCCTDMEVNKHRNLVDKGPKNESFRIPNLRCLSATFIWETSCVQMAGFRYQYKVLNRLISRLLSKFYCVFCNRKWLDHICFVSTFASFPGWYFNVSHNFWQYRIPVYRLYEIRRQKFIQWIVQYKRQKLEMSWVHWPLIN